MVIEAKDNQLKMLPLSLVVPQLQSGRRHNSGLHGTALLPGLTLCD